MMSPNCNNNVSFYRWCFYKSKTWKTHTFVCLFIFGEKKSLWNEETTKKSYICFAFVSLYTHVRINTHTHTRCILKFNSYRNECKKRFVISRCFGFFFNSFHIHDKRQNIVIVPHHQVVFLFIFNRYTYTSFHLYFTFK